MRKKLWSLSWWSAHILPVSFYSLILRYLISFYELMEITKVVSIGVFLSHFFHFIQLKAFCKWRQSQKSCNGDWMLQFFEFLGQLCNSSTWWVTESPNRFCQRRTQFKNIFVNVCVKSAGTKCWSQKEAQSFKYVVAYSSVRKYIKPERNNPMETTPIFKMSSFQMFADGQISDPHWI